MHDSVTPFHSDPIITYSQHHHPPPPSQTTRLDSSLAVSSIGNRSLIGLLGGTRFDFHGAGLLEGVGEDAGGEIHEEEEGEQLELEDGLAGLRAGGRAGRVGGMSL